MTSYNLYLFKTRTTVALVMLKYNQPVAALVASHTHPYTLAVLLPVLPGASLPSQALLSACLGELPAAPHCLTALSTCLEGS